MELARVRLRGIYAALAGVVLGLIVPYLQGTLLFSQGYANAVTPIAAHQNFAPLVAWIAANGGADRALRLVGLVPYLGLVVLPPSLAVVIWNREGRAARVARFTGQAGFGLYLVAGVLGLLTSASAAASYAAAHTTAARAAAVDAFASTYSIETLLSRVLGGLLLTVFLVVVSLALGPSRAMPVWVAYFGFLVAALTGVTALLFAFAPGQPTTPTSALAYYALAIWLVAVGYYLLRMVEVEVVVPPIPPSPHREADNGKELPPSRAQSR